MLHRPCARRKTEKLESNITVGRRGCEDFDSRQNHKPLKPVTTKDTKYHEAARAMVSLREPSCPWWLRPLRRVQLRSVVCPPQNLILATHEPAGILLRLYMAQLHITRKRPEQRNAISDQHRHARDHDTLNETSSQKSLHRDPAVYVHVLRPAGGKPRGNLG